MLRRHGTRVIPSRSRAEDWADSPWHLTRAKIVDAGHDLVGYQMWCRSTVPWDQLVQAPAEKAHICAACTEQWASRGDPRLALDEPHDEPV